jgi:hypothetical protein
MNPKLIEELQSYALKGAAVIASVIAFVLIVSSGIGIYQFVNKQISGTTVQNQEQ